MLRIQFHNRYPQHTSEDRGRVCVLLCFLAPTVKNPLANERSNYLGCTTCRRCRLKCDEGKPSCKVCNDRGVTCEGYATNLRWINTTVSMSRRTKGLQSHTRTNPLPGANSCRRHWDDHASNLRVSCPLQLSYDMSLFPEADSLELYLLEHHIGMARIVFVDAGFMSQRNVDCLRIATSLGSLSPLFDCIHNP